MPPKTKATLEEVKAELTDKGTNVDNSTKQSRREANKAEKTAKIEQIKTARERRKAERIEPPIKQDFER